MQTKLRIALAGGAATLIAASSMLVSPAFAARVYNDVPPNHWAYNAVQWAGQYAIMLGPDGQPGFFNAGAFANRAEIATVLFRFYNLVERQITDLQVRVDLLESRVDALDGGGRSSSSRSSSSRSSSSSSHSGMSSSHSSSMSSLMSSMSSSMSSASSNSSISSSLSSSSSSF